MGLLGILHLGDVFAGLGRQIVLAKIAGDQLARRAQGFLAKRGGVRAHVGDESVFVKLLSNSHRAAGGEAQLAISLLLQRAGNERSGGLRDEGLLLHLLHQRRALLQPLLEFSSLGRVQPQQIRGTCKLAGGRVKILARSNAAISKMGELSFKFTGRVTAGIAQLRLQRPETGLAEADPLTFALHQQADGDALYTACAKARRHLLPKKRAHFIAIQTINNSPRLLGLYKVLVDIARVGKRLQNGILGDFVEHHPVDGHLGLQGLHKVPAD